MPAEPNQAEPRKRNIRLVIEYDGADYSGWQRQPEKRTVQGCIEEALTAVTGQTPALIASGRTDSGVHAEGQVANFRTAGAIPAWKFVGALNDHLAPDVAVLSAEDVPWSFHANRDAKTKLYRYSILTRSARPALERRFIHWVRASLDTAAMREAAAHFVGTHDFNSFRAEGSVEKNTVRTIDKVELDETADRITLHFLGDGFLYMMVRVITGTLLQVGLGKIAPADIPAIIEARNRTAAGPTAPPEGLCLVRVYY